MRLLCVWLLALAAGYALAPAALASEPIESFHVATTSTQAGGHPDLTVEFALEKPGEPESAKSVQIDLPAGQILNPLAVTACTMSDFGASNCAPGSQVGFVTVRKGNPDLLLGTAAVYDLVPASGELGRIGFVIPTIDVPVEAALTLRSEGDYGARLEIEELPPSGSPLKSAHLSLWGVPADPSHDASRLPKGTTGCPGAESLSCNGSPVPSPLPAAPFTVNPVHCSAPQPWKLDVRTVGDPTTPSTGSTETRTPTGCALLTFNPATTLSLTTNVTGTATGLDLTVKDALSLSPTNPMQSPLLLSESDLHGLVKVDRAKLEAVPVCSEQQAKIEEPGPAACPEASKLGTAKIGSPLLPEEKAISGGLYYGGALGGGANAVYLTASGHGLDVKTVLVLEAFEVGGATLLEAPGLPELPISELEMKFEGGGTSVLRTGSRCGPHKARTFLVPWNFTLLPQVTSNTIVLNRPGGGVCAEEAAFIDIEAPPGLPADGASTGTVTARISDKSQVPVVGDEVEIEASDPDVAIGPVVDNEDGTYTASVTASTTPGPVTITATDYDVEPPLRGEHVMVLAPVVTPPPPSGQAPPPPPATSPRTTIGKHPPRSGRKRRVSFAFSADVQGSTFSCKLDSRAYRPCASPLRLAGLKPGRHTFSVFATGPSGLAGIPAKFSFTVRRPRR